MVECEYCGSELSSEASLKYHQKNAKKCLSIRGLSSSNKCEDCNRFFPTKKKLETHIGSCIEKKLHDVEHSKNERLEIAASEISGLKSKLDEKEKETERMKLLHKKELEEKEKKIEELIKEMNKNKDEIIKNQMETIQLAVSKGKGNVNNGIINIQQNILKESLSELCNQEHMQEQIDTKFTRIYMVGKEQLEYSICDFFVDIIIRGKDGEIQIIYSGKLFNYMGNNHEIVSDDGDTIIEMIKENGIVPLINKKMMKIWNLFTQEERKDIGYPLKPPQLEGLTWQFIKKMMDRTSIGNKNAKNIKRTLKFGPTPNNKSWKVEEKEEKKKIEKRKKAIEKYEIVMKGEIAKLDVYVDEETVTDMIKRKKEERKQENEGNTPKWVFYSNEEDNIERMVDFDDHKEILDEQIQRYGKASYKFNKTLYPEETNSTILVAISEKKPKETEAERLRFYMKKL